MYPHVGMGTMSVMTREHRSGKRAVVRLLTEAGIMVAAYLAYEAVRRLVAPDSSDAFGHAANIIRFEQEMGIFFEPSLQGMIVDHEWLVTLFNWVYVWGYLPVIAAAALYLYVRHHDFYTRYRNAFLLSGAAGLAIFATLPVAPPRMFPEFGFVDTVHAQSSVYRSLQGSDLVNEFAAVPSFHFGWILLVGIAIIETNHNPLARTIGVALPLLMLAAIIFTANHYVVDAIIGGAVVLSALATVRLGEIARERWVAAASGQRLQQRAQQ
jgi:PAP2 superfamily protein